MKVYTDSSNPQLWRVLVTAKYANQTVEVVNGVDANSKETLAKSGLGKLPFLETSEGTIFGATAIVRYLARVGKGHLYGSNDFEAGLIEQFVAMSAVDIELPASVWVFPILGYIPNNSTAVQKAKGDVRKVLDYLNKHLVSRTFLVGERVTVADIVVACSLYYLYTKVLDLGFRKPYPHVTRWFMTVVNQPDVKGVVGEVHLCEKMEVAPESANVAHEEHEPKKEAKPKEEKPKKESKPKEKPKDEEAEEEDEFADKESKKPNPLDSLPPSKLNMDEWKRTYSNKETRTEALPWFFEHLDLEGYSLWFCDYKYNEECEKVFMTANLIGGWYQRLDKVRKYGFGSVCIFGEEPKLEVGGVWLFRGPEPTQEMKETDDYVNFNWKKVDLTDSAQKELLSDYFAWDGNFGGKKFSQGKIFK